MTFVITCGSLDTRGRTLTCETAQEAPKLVGNLMSSSNEGLMVSSDEGGAEEIATLKLLVTSKTQSSLKEEPLCLKRAQQYILDGEGTTAKIRSLLNEARFRNANIAPFEKTLRNTELILSEWRSTIKILKQIEMTLRTMDAHIDCAGLSISRL